MGLSEVAAAPRTGWLQGQCPPALGLSLVANSRDLAAPGEHLESTGELSIEAAIAAGLPSWVQPKCHVRNGPAAVTAGVTPCPLGVLLAGDVPGVVSAGKRARCLPPFHR